MDKETQRTPQLWIVDRQEYWRSLSEDVLRSAGFAIQVYKAYSTLLSCPDNSKPDLVLLGCTSYSEEEKHLLRELTHRNWPVIALVSSLSLPDLRAFFHAGAMDVAERPQTPNQLLSLIKADLRSTNKGSTLEETSACHNKVGS
jgi:DNA-binding NtrC family response regulator